VQSSGAVRTSEISEALGISLPTVRRDLRILATRNLIERTHGGALARSRGTTEEPLFAEKARQMRAEKERIAECAASLVTSGATVILDSGSTVLAIARRLAGKKITIIALDLPAAQAVAHGHTEVLVVGGRVRNGLFSLVGPWAECALRSVNADLFFLGADAIDDGQVTNSTLDEAAVKRLALEAAASTVLVADHTKFGRKALALVCRLGELGMVITDKGIGPYEESVREQVRRLMVV
jgi:DeoR/GlpR family transcriptional regulator of sugar metabolism